MVEAPRHNEPLSASSRALHDATTSGPVRLAMLDRLFVASALPPLAEDAVRVALGEGDEPFWEDGAFINTVDGARAALAAVLQRHAEDEDVTTYELNVLALAAVTVALSHEIEPSAKTQPCAPASALVSWLATKKAAALMPPVGRLVGETRDNISMADGKAALVRLVRRLLEIVGRKHPLALDVDTKGRLLLAGKVLRWRRPAQRKDRVDAIEHRFIAVSNREGKLLLGATRSRPRIIEAGVASHVRTALRTVSHDRVKLTEAGLEPPLRLTARAIRAAERVRRG